MRRPVYHWGFLPPLRAWLLGAVELVALARSRRSLPGDAGRQRRIADQQK